MDRFSKYSKIFLYSVILFLILLFIDNLFWISASPEFYSTFTVSNSIGSWIGPINNYNFIQLTNYVLLYRGFTVISNWRDLTASLGFGLIVMFSIILYDFLDNKNFYIRA